MQSYLQSSLIRDLFWADCWKGCYRGGSFGLDNCGNTWWCPYIHKESRVDISSLMFQSDAAYLQLRNIATLAGAPDSAFPDEPIHYPLCGHVVPIAVQAAHAREMCQQRLYTLHPCSTCYIGLK